MLCDVRRTKTDLGHLFRLFTIKGAPDVLMERCSAYIGPTGHSYPLDDVMKAKYESIKNMYSGQGRRCLLLARKVVPAENLMAEVGSAEHDELMMEQSKSGLTLVGLVSIVDPLRSEIPEVVSTLRRAGIRICMVSLVLSEIPTITLFSVPLRRGFADMSFPELYRSPATLPSQPSLSPAALAL